jgi:predicted GNAT superfamily acetyltransferase
MVEYLVIMIEIRKVETHADFERCVDLQKMVWGFSDRDVVPSRTLVVAQKHGGCVLGAYTESGELIGFALALASFYANQPAQYSSMLAVLPEYQGQGIGWRLKLVQRQEALARGLKVITWTFDPLESKNAHLNINKLGAIVRTYYENLYPASTSEIHSGLGTDRFLAEWWIESERVNALLDRPASAERTADRPDEDAVLISSLPRANQVSYAQGLPQTMALDLDRSEARLLVEIPVEIQELKARNLELAKDWRARTRVVFKHYFEKKYTVTRLLMAPCSPAPDRRAFYLLERAAETR